MNEPGPDPTLARLFDEMVTARQAIQDALKLSPEDVQLHRIHGMYVGQILDIRKALVQEQGLDKDQLLIDALKGVVRFLLDKGEEDAARFIGEHLEEIGLKVKEIWQDSKPFQNWPPDTKTSAKPSPRRSRPSVKPPRRKGNGAANAPSNGSVSSPKPTSPIT